MTAASNLGTEGERRWQQLVRGQVREYVAKVGDPPPLTAWVSEGDSPRRARLVECKPGLRPPKELIVEAVKVHGSHFCAIGARLRMKDDTDERGRVFGLVVIEPWELVKFGAILEPQHGPKTFKLGGWQPGTFDVGDDFAFAQQAVRSARG